MSDRRKPRKKSARRKPSKTLTRELKGAKAVHRRGDLTYAWFGGSQVHVYNRSGKEVDVYNNRNLDGVGYNPHTIMKEHIRIQESEGDYTDSYGNVYRHGKKIGTV